MAITLKNGFYTLLAEPEKGGLVSELFWKQFSLLYSPENPPKANNGIPLYGCWPLVPFANKAFNGILRFDGKNIRLPCNDGSNTMHGFGWQSNWAIVDQQSNSLTMEHRSSDLFPPYIYTAYQKIEIHDDGVTFYLGVRNTGDSSLPYGLGFHPWFPCDSNTKLTATADRKMVFGEQYCPLGVAEIDANSDFSEPKLIQAGSEIAINYLNWHGLARLDYSCHSLKIEASDNLRTPVLWTPKSADFVCFEPQSHASGAPSELAAHKSAPLKVLRPGESLQGWMRLQAFHTM